MKKFLLLGACACLGACANLAGYVSSKIQADTATFDNAVVAVNDDLLQAKRDYQNPLLLLADAEKLASDKQILVAAYNVLVADYKALGQAAPTKPSVMQ